MAYADTPLYEAIHEPREYLAAYQRLMDEPSNRLRVRAVAETVARIPTDVGRVIDIASGGGAYVDAIRSANPRIRTARFVPVDRQFACVGGYRLNHGASGAIADVEALPFRANAFDLALCLDIIEHLDGDVTFLRDVRRLLVPGGWLLVSTHNSRSIEHVIGSTTSLLRRRVWRGWDPTHIRFYNATSLGRLLDRAGFDLASFNGTYYLPFHFPARVCSWGFERAGMSTVSRAVYRTVSAPGYAVNAIFERISHLTPFSRLGWGIIALARKK